MASGHRGQRAAQTRCYMWRLPRHCIRNWQVKLGSKSKVLEDGRIGIGIPLSDKRIFGPDGHFYKHVDAWTNGDLRNYDTDEFKYLKGKNDALLAKRLYKMYARKLQPIDGKMVPCTARFTKLQRGFTPSGGASHDPLTVTSVNIAFDTIRVYWMEPGKSGTFKSWSDSLTRDYIPWLTNIEVGNSNEETKPFKETGRRREKEPSDVFPNDVTEGTGAPV